MKTYAVDQMHPDSLDNLSDDITHLIINDRKFNFKIPVIPISLSSLNLCNCDNFNKLLNKLPNTLKIFDII